METTVPEITRYGSIALFLLAVAFVLAAPFFWQHVELTDVPASESYENSDLYQFVYPAMHYAYGRVRSGQAPQWNARQMCGMPLLADHRIGLFQPLNAVFLLPDTGQAMALHSFICLALMGFGCVLFARSLDLDYGAALVGGIVYAFAGASAAAMSRPHLASALAWMPFLFWASREFARSGRRGWALLAGLAGAAFILSGAYAIVAVTLPLVVLYTILHGFTRRPGEFGLRIALGGILLGGALALCLAAVQWVPTAAWAMTLDSPADALWYLRSGGLLPGSFREAVAQTFSSRPGDLPRLCYVGMLPLILVPAACFQRKNWRETLVFLLAGAGAWALGAVGPQRVVAGLPREAFLYLAVFCVAILAALGADRIFKPRKDYRSVHVWPVAIVVFLALCGVFYVAEGQGRGYVIAFAILLAPFLILRQTWVSVLATCAAALLIFIDLTLASLNAYGHPYQDFPEHARRYSESLETARERALGGRVAIMSRPLDYGLPANLGLLTPIDVAGGCNLFVTREQRAWWSRLIRHGAGGDPVASWDVSPDAVQPSLLNFMTVRAILASPDTGIPADAWNETGLRLREIQTPARGTVYINESALPRVFWVPAWRLADDVDAAMDALASPGFEPARECVVDAAHGPYLEQLQRRGPGQPEAPRGEVVAAVLSTAQPAVAPEPSAPPAGEAPLTPRVTPSPGTLEERSPERLAVHVEVPQAGIVVLSDSFARGWRASLDGVPCEILRVNGIFRGVAVPAGVHDIVFTYRPASLYLGIGIALFGAALLVGSLLAAAWQRS